NDGDADSEVATVSISINGVNDAPEITSSSEFSALENQKSIGQVIATDVDNDDLEFSVVGDNLEIDSDTGVLSFIIEPDYETKQQYIGEVTVSDGIEFVSQTITINILDVDDTAPIIQGSTTYTVFENLSNLILGSYSTEEGVDILISGDDVGAIILNNNNLAFSEVPDYENPTDNDSDNIYRVILSATDNFENTSQIEITIEVQDIDEIGPVISGSELITVTENIKNLNIASFTANESVTWGLLGDDKDLFEIRSNGKLLFLESPDYENPNDSDVDNDYNLIITAVDNLENNSELNIVVRVEDDDDTSPRISLKGPNPITIAQNSEYKEPGYVAIDNKDGDISSNVVVTTNLDTKTVGDYTIEYNVSDNKGNKADAVVRNVKVSDQTAPVITGASSVQVLENTSDLFISSYVSNDENAIWGVLGNDSKYFEFKDGKLSFISSPDFENRLDYDDNNVYDLTLTSTDDKNN
ncbi:DUF5011 domain-containing protein, partial [archaeon]|nr:DUF5011 domain-containing protein [archaeon]